MVQVSAQKTRKKVAWLPISEQFFGYIYTFYISSVWYVKEKDGNK